MATQLAVTRSAEEFAKVKAGMQVRESLPYEFMAWMLLGLCILITLSVLATWVRKKRRGVLVRGWTTINEPHRLAAVFKRAAARQADCTLEIFDHQHTTIYRGQVFAADQAGQQIFLELSQPPNGDVDFADFPALVHLNFRPGLQEVMEHYQFSSRTLGIDFQREKTWRAARVAVAWPMSVISGQRRDFLRVEPWGEHALKADLKAVPGNTAGSPDSLPAAAAASVVDISIGGLQLLIPGRPALAEDQPLVATLDLPLSGLEAEIKNPRLHLLVRIISREAAAAPDARTIIRGRFIGRYRRHPVTGTWEQAGFSEETFQDLTRWIHAYQRCQLKKDKGLLPFEVDRVNSYPSIPPERRRKNDDGDDDDGEKPA